MSTTKSPVGMGHSICPICGKKYDRVVLIDRRLAPTLTNNMTHDLKLCPEHAVMVEEYIAFVEVSNTNMQPGALLKPQDADYTGNYAHVRRTVLPHILTGVPIPPANMPFIYCEKGTVTKLEALMKASGIAEGEGNTPD